MSLIIRNGCRVLLVCIYPAILFLSFYLVYKKDKYKKAIKENIKPLLINTLVICLIISLGIIIFFHFEDTIYSYDFAGHWTRALTLRQYFFEDYSSILRVVYNSMNYDDYSFLPALFGLPFIIINTSYSFFCLSNFIYFLLPTIILLEIVYFTKYQNKYLPSIIFLLFYPLYFCIFFGEVDGIGLFFILMMYILIFFEDYENISIKDNLIVNLYAFNAMFLRRWYLYVLVAFYLCYFIKYLVYYKRKFINIDFLKIISSGLLMLCVVLLFFRPFLLNALNNNYSESYAFYDRDGKFLWLINFYSILIWLVTLFGIYKSFIKNKLLTIIQIIMVAIPIVLFWRIQSFEYHHYYQITLNILLFFIDGIASIKKKTILAFISVVLLIQTLSIYIVDYKIPGFTSLKKRPEVNSQKEAITNFSNYLYVLCEENKYSYMATGSKTFNDDIVRNSKLPDLDMPNIDSAVLDLRDGFPRNFKYIDFVIVSDPIQYYDKDYQHIYDVITNAIKNEPIVSSNYTKVYSTKIYNFTVEIYQRTGEYTEEMKQYFYDEMLKIYPDKADFFSYILD